MEEVTESELGGGLEPQGAQGGVPNPQGRAVHTVQFLSNQ